MSATSMTTAWFSRASGEGLRDLDDEVFREPEDLGAPGLGGGLSGGEANAAAKTANAVMAADRLRVCDSWRISGVSFPGGMGHFS